MKLALPLAALFTLACATQPVAPVAAPAPVVAAAPAPAPDCVPGHAIVNATVWMQTAAEYRAATLGTYAAARRQLDAALADPSWSAIEGQTNAASLPPAIILDVDETVVDNSRYEVRAIRKGVTFDNELWRQWVEESAAEAVPGAAEFLAYAKSRGVTPFYITNRDDVEEPGTRRNLEKLGFPLSAAEDTLLTRSERPEWRPSDKGPRRAHVAARYRVLLVFGDDLNDFANAREKSRAERDEIINRSAALWGTKWFMIPNPIYGSWERAVSAGTTGCDQLRKKIEVLEP